MLRRPAVLALLLSGVTGLIGVIGLTGCSTTRPGAAEGTSSTPLLRVVAAENFWGSIAAQIGGPRVSVVSIIDNPDADPHDYEPTAQDARTVDQAQVVIGNGIGYDPWFAKLVASDPARPVSVDVGTVVGLRVGANPHQWYSPVSVAKVVSALTAAFTRALPAQAAGFTAGQQNFEQHTLVRYNALVASIRRTYGNVAVGASESILAPLAPSLGLRLITPPGFLTAVSEGTEPSAADKAIVDAQIARRQIKVWVYNVQNATPDVARLNAAAKAAGIPVTTVTETMTPAGATFQDWQSDQLERLQAALAQAMK